MMLLMKVPAGADDRAIAGSVGIRTVWNPWSRLVIGGKDARLAFHLVIFCCYMKGNDPPEFAWRCKGG